MPLSVKIVILVTAILFFVLGLSTVSTFFSYVRSSSVKTFFYYVLPAILVVLVIALQIYGYVKCKREARLHEFRLENPVYWFFCLVVFAVLLSYAISASLAIPTRLFATHEVDMPVVVGKLSGYRLNHGHWVWIYFNGDQMSDKFMWVWSDPVVFGLKQGDCINLHAREWALGFYVDRISRSNACSLPSE